MLIDSGTTLTYLVSAAYGPVMEAFQARVAYSKVNISGMDLCYDVTWVGSPPTFPSLAFTFTDGAKLEFPQANYMINMTDSDTIMCLALGESKQLNILGNVQQQNYHFIYDLQNSRLGWSGPVDCSSQ